MPQKAMGFRDRFRDGAQWCLADDSRTALAWVAVSLLASAATAVTLYAMPLPPLPWWDKALRAASMCSLAVSAFMPQYVCGFWYAVWRIPIDFMARRRIARANLYRDAYAIVSGDFDFSQFHYELSEDDERFWDDVAAVRSGEFFERFRIDATG